MENNIAFLELKYGNIYGGFPNFFAIAEVSLLVFEKRSKKIFIESWVNKADVDYVSVISKTNELGHTIGREKEVINMRTGRKRPFMEEFKVDKRALQYSFKQLTFYIFEVPPHALLLQARMLSQMLTAVSAAQTEH